MQVDARIGRTLAEGMRGSRRRRAADPTVYAFSLFTNDEPGDAALLETRPHERRAWLHGVGDDRGPPRRGAGYAAANRRLRALASSGEVRIVPWAEQVRAHPEWLAGDRVHATPNGYKERAELFADAIRRCG